MPHRRPVLLLARPATVNQGQGTMTVAGEAGAKGALRIDRLSLLGGGAVGMIHCPGRNHRDAGGGRWARGLAAEELQGGTFTISNLGMYGVTEFSAIINPPQVGILAVARPVERAVVRNGWVVIRSQLSATLSADHRALDGVTGAAFLEALKAVLEDPERLLL